MITNLSSSKRREFSNFWRIPFLVRIGSLYILTIITEYILNNETDYTFLKPRKRKYKRDSIFKSYLTGEQNEYGPYEKDIALVHIYFDSSSIIEYQRQVTMTW